MGLFDPVPGQQVFGPQLPSYDELQGCIRCGRCLPVCPTYQQTQLEMFSPRGRLSLLRAVEDGKLDLTAGVEEHLYHCLDCRACNTVCPPGVHIGELIVHGRVAAAEKRRASLAGHVHVDSTCSSARNGPRFISAPLRLRRRSDSTGSARGCWAGFRASAKNCAIWSRLLRAWADRCGRACTRHAGAGREAPSRRLFPGLHDERGHARREPRDGARVDARRAARS